MWKKKKNLNSPPPPRVLTARTVSARTPNHLRRGAIRHSRRVRAIPRVGVGMRVSRMRLGPPGPSATGRNKRLRATMRGSRTAGGGRRRASPMSEAALGAPLIRHLGLVPYEPTWRAMQRFTTSATIDAR